MKKRTIIAAIVLCFIIFFSLPVSSAEQWCWCTVDQVGINAVSGYYYVQLEYVSGGTTSWTGPRGFRLHPNADKTLMAVMLTAQSNNLKVSVWLADTAAYSLVLSAWTISE
jgi:hypothetical protein